MEPKRQVVQEFQETVWRYYDRHGRNLPWREPGVDGAFDAYKIMVSEIMLQQTQVSRVVAKYQEFLAAFPTVKDLAQAGLGQVLVLWNGLGYNRRAKFLWQAARMVVDQCAGVMPRTSEQLVKLPGIGLNTASAIAAYAYDSPEVYVETNIRTVYIHHFFNDQIGIDDKEILELVRETLPEEQYREWYWALMDYGTYLKTTVGNLNKASKHYTKQSRFEGSKRQLRGAVLRMLSTRSMTQSELEDTIKDDRLSGVLNDLIGEQMIKLSAERYQL